MVAVSIWVLMIKLVGDVAGDTILLMRHTTASAYALSVYTQTRMHVYIKADCSYAQLDATTGTGPAQDAVNFPAHSHLP